MVKIHIYFERKLEVYYDRRVYNRLLFSLENNRDSTVL